MKLLLALLEANEKVSALSIQQHIIDDIDEDAEIELSYGRTNVIMSIVFSHGYKTEVKVNSSTDVTAAVDKIQKTFEKYKPTSSARIKHELMRTIEDIVKSCDVPFKTEWGQVFCYHDDDVSKSVARTFVIELDPLAVKAYKPGDVNATVSAGGGRVKKLHDTLPANPHIIYNTYISRTSGQDVLKSIHCVTEDALRIVVSELKRLNRTHDDTPQ